MTRPPPALRALSALVRALPALLLAATLLVAGVATSAVEESTPEAAAPVIYKWTDTNGIAHYTTEFEKIPRALRRDARRLDAPGSAATAPAPQDRTPASRARAGTTEAERWARTDRPPTFDDGWGEDAAEWDEGATDAGPSFAEIEARLREIDAEIALLEADIAADEEVLKRFVAAPPPQSPAEVAYDVGFREVAERLPGLLSELRTLQDERAELETP